MRLRTRTPWLGAACLVLGAAAAVLPPGGPAAIPAGGFETATLPELAAAADAWTEGVIRRVDVRAVDPGDGAPLYLTTLVIEGTTYPLRRAGTEIASQAEVEAPAPPLAVVEVQFPGGFVDEEHGSFNSIAPPRHAIRIGRRVVTFHRHDPNAYADGPGRVLIGGRAGLFTAFVSRGGATIVQGRADSVALPHNVPLDVLKQRLAD